MVDDIFAYGMHVEYENSVLLLKEFKKARRHYLEKTKETLWLFTFRPDLSWCINVSNKHVNASYAFIQYLEIVEKT